MPAKIDSPIVQNEYYQADYKRAAIDLSPLKDLKDIANQTGQKQPSTIVKKMDHIQ